MTHVAEPFAGPKNWTGRACLPKLRLARPVVAPSMLLCDFGNLEREIRRLEDAGAQVLHLDVMDGIFVPNSTYGLTIVETCRRLTTLPLDVHLMVARPADCAADFVKVGGDLVSFHVEATPDPAPILQQIKDLGAAPGIVLNPGTPLASILPYLPLCDQVLVMSVQAGFGGQAFQEVALEKLQELKSRLPSDAILSVDGGVNDKTIGTCVRAGAQLLVVGSAIFKHEDYRERVAALTQLAKSA